MRWLANPGVTRAPYTARERTIVSVESARRARAEIENWEGYAPTPLRSLPRLAHDLGLAVVLYKDESRRLGLRSFKALGGAYASRRALDRFLERGGTFPSELIRPNPDLPRPTLCCATDGNHGHAVAVAARRLGCECMVFMHEHAPEPKAQAIRALGARVVRTPGTYDDSVAIARECARTHDWIPILDTSDTEQDDTVRDVMNGYAVIALEVVEQVQTHLPTHVFVQAGVGGLAAAIAGTLAELLGEKRPRIIVVEPERAACVLEAAASGAPVRIKGDLATAMEMLSCGVVSRPAWTILRARADAFVAVEDAAARGAQKTLQMQPDEEIDVGISGAASVAGLIACSADKALREALELDRSAHVLVFGTEGAGIEAAEGITPRDLV